MICWNSRSAAASGPATAVGAGGASVIDGPFQRARSAHSVAMRDISAGYEENAASFRSCLRLDCSGPDDKC
jgi:hypothetical protein